MSTILHRFRGSGSALLGLGLMGANAWAQLPPLPVSPAPVVNLEYDAQGNPTRSVRGGLSTSNAYDSLSRRVTTTDARGKNTGFGYNGREDLTRVTDPRSLQTAYSRTGLGDATGLVSPDTGTTSHTLDAAGKLLTRTDSRGALASYAYDALNRLNSATYSQAGQETEVFRWNYDQSGPGYSYGQGRLTSTQYPAGSTTYAYDALGRLVSTTQTVVAGGLSTALNTSYGYDGAGHVVSVTYPSGRVLYIPHAGGQPTGMSLVPPGGAALPLIAGLQFEPGPGEPGAARSWYWQLDGGGSLAHARYFDNYGRMVRHPLGGAVRDISYDTAGRIALYAHYDAISGSAVTALNQAFGYDELDRLTSVTTGVGSWAIGYDDNGNRTVLNANTAAGYTSRAYSVDAASNRLLGISSPARSYTYDAAGNITNLAEEASGWTAAYSASGRLERLFPQGSAMGTLAVEGARYAYNGDGQRVSKVLPGDGQPVDPICTDGQGNIIPCGSGGEGTSSFKVMAAPARLSSKPRTAATATTSATSVAVVGFEQATVYVYGQQGELLGEYSAGTGSPIREYVWLQGMPVVAVDGAVASPTVYYIQTDHLDTPRVMLDRQGRQRWSWVAEPFGNSAPVENPIGVGVVPMNLRMPGQYFDAESGLLYNWNRTYDASVGRYVQSDPIGLAGGINTYTYVGGNPVSYVDPEGKNLVLGGIIVVGGIIYAGHKVYSKFESFNQENEACKRQCETTVACGDSERTGQYQDNASRCIATCKANATIGNFFGIGKGPTGPKSPDSTPDYFKKLPPADGRP